MTGCTVIRHEQLYTSPETIEQELRPAVCEHRQTDIQTERQATLTIWQCHICYVGHHREYYINKRHQQHRDPESRPKWNLNDVSLQTTR